MARSPPTRRGGWRLGTGPAQTLRAMVHRSERRAPNSSTRMAMSCLIEPAALSAVTRAAAPAHRTPTLQRLLWYDCSCNSSYAQCIGAARHWCAFCMFSVSALWLCILSLASCPSPHLSLNCIHAIMMYAFLSDQRWWIIVEDCLLRR